MTLAQADFRAANCPGGDHMLLLGQVMSVECQGEASTSEPLLYYTAAFRAKR